MTAQIVEVERRVPRFTLKTP